MTTAVRQQRIEMDGTKTLQERHLRAVIDGEREEFSSLDSFLIRIGAKEMSTTTKTSPIEWNRSVLGLLATLITVLSVFAVVLWNYATVTADFRNYQRTTDERMLRQDKAIDDMRIEINRFKEFQIKSDAYRLGVADSHGEKPKEK